MNQQRLPIIALLIISLVCAGAARQWASNLRGRGVGAAIHSGGQGLSGMDSYALALLLGGLRGPLVMFLWPSTEEQKRLRNLEDFNTKIEWIRLLQAEFDTVHIFQIWNKAYNISAQMANLGNKYRTIIDALQYAHDVDRERPNNINIIYATAQLYFEKLGSSFEKPYYLQRVREETQARKDQMRITLPPERREEMITLATGQGMPQARLHFTPVNNDGLVSITLPKTVAEAVQPRFSGTGVTFTDRPRLTAGPKTPGWQQTELDPILDAQGNILPQYLVPTLLRSATTAESGESLDGSDLQFLKQYEPFPYGLSSLALGYNYYKRVQVLQSKFNQQHAQLSRMLIDSRPAVALEIWSGEEWERARRAEIEAFGLQIPTEREALEAPTAGIALTAPLVHRPRIDEALFGYARVARLADDAISKYEDHLKIYTTNMVNYLGHIDELRGAKALCTGDLNFLQAMIDPAQRDKDLTSAAEQYRDARYQYQQILLRAYVPAQAAANFYPPGVTRQNIVQKKLPREQVNELFSRVQPVLATLTDPSVDTDTIHEYLSYISRAEARLKSLNR